MARRQLKKIKVTLQKVYGSEEIDVLGLTSNYNSAATLGDLYDVIEDPDFSAEVCCEPQSYDIEVEETGYDVEPCEGCDHDPCESLNRVFKEGITLYSNLYILHWMAKGNDMMKLHLLSEELYQELISEIDTIGELLVEKCGQVPQPGWCCDYLQIRPYEFQESLVILTRYIQSFIDTIQYAHINQTSDVQSVLDEWLRYWNKQLNYFVKGQEV